MIGFPIILANEATVFASLNELLWTSKGGKPDIGWIARRFAVAGRLLAGLHVYKAQPAGKEKANGSPLPARSGKQERRLAKAAAKQQIHIEGAEQLARYRLPRSSVEGAHFYHELELLVTRSRADPIINLMA